MPCSFSMVFIGRSRAAAPIGDEVLSNAEKFHPSIGPSVRLPVPPGARVSPREAQAGYLDALNRPWKFKSRPWEIQARQWEANARAWKA